MDLRQERHRGEVEERATLGRRASRALVGVGAVALVALTALAATPVTPHAGAKKRVGIDVSRFQGTIKWNQVSRTNVSFAFLQASRGSGGDCSVVTSECGGDRTYRRNYRRASANGIRVGPYHRAFAGGDNPRDARRDARREARVFMRSVRRLRDDDLRPALDLEHPFAGMTPRRLRIWTRTWLRIVERRYGTKPIIYTNHSSWQATGDARGFARRGHPLWVAHWKVPRRSILVPAANWDGAGWSVWQWTSEGRIRGIAGPVDRNRMRVSLSRLSVGGDRAPAAAHHRRR